LEMRSLAFVVLLIMLFSGVVGGGDYDSAAVPLLERIALGEGTSDAAAQQHGLASAYDITYAYGQYNPQDSKPLTEMTIGEVKQLQQQMISNQANSNLPSSAVGKYQLVSATLAEEQNKLGLSDDTKFDAATQELFGLSLLEKRGYTDWIDGRITDHDFQKNLAKEWASVADPDTGASYYGQSVGTTDIQIKEAMAQTKSLLGISQETQEVQEQVTSTSDSGLVRIPRIGDNVSINSGPSVNSEGTITDIGNGLICLHQVGTYGESDMCIGIDSIRRLSWTD
jgi:hypothetical protein